MAPLRLQVITQCTGLTTLQLHFLSETQVCLLETLAAGQPLHALPAVLLPQTFIS